MARRAEAITRSAAVMLADALVEYAIAQRRVESICADLDASIARQRQLNELLEKARVNQTKCEELVAQANQNLMNAVAKEIK